MLLADLTGAMESIAPLRFAESWDNVGLIAGDPAASISKVLLTIDYTDQVAQEAVQLGCEAVVTYHPPIFEGLKRVAAGNVVFDAIRRGIALYSPHTALDVAPGGTNDVLADIVGMAPDRMALRPSAAKDTHVKLVTFIPEAAYIDVSNALFEAGAGRIGDYESCGFYSSGTGSFLGGEQSNPKIGTRGNFEQVPELRFETLVPLKAVPKVLAALHRSHPYEEPAVDLVRLMSNDVAQGLGRVGAISGVTRAEICERLKVGLGVEHLLVAGKIDGRVQRVAVCAGSGGEFLGDAMSHKVDVYITGELRHHDALRARRSGMMIVCALHSNSERATLVHLKTRLEQALSGVQFHLATSDKDPFRIT